VLHLNTGARDPFNFLVNNAKSQEGKEEDSVYHDVCIMMCVRSACEKRRSGVGLCGVCAVC